MHRSPRTTIHYLRASADGGFQSFQRIENSEAVEVMMMMMVVVVVMMMMLVMMMMMLMMMMKHDET